MMNAMHAFFSLLNRRSLPGIEWGFFFGGKLLRMTTNLPRRQSSVILKRGKGFPF